MLNPTSTRLSRALGAVLVAVTLTAPLALAGCGSAGPKLPPAGSAEPDKFLFDRGTEALAKKRWMAAREYFRTLVERYPQSVYRPDAKLAVGDTYILENTVESKILAINEFTEFLSFFPTHRRADYAQLQIGYAHYRQMAAPQRDQTETREAITEFQTFLQKYPSSTLMPEALKYLRAAKDRLSQSEFEVGRFYARINWCPGTVERLGALMKNDPDFINRDGVYFYLGECYFKSQQYAVALPHFDKLVSEFSKSSYLDKSKKRIEEIKKAMAAAPPAIKKSSSATR